jgi:poly-gamma-glutamate synthesis protein (capsule biosynthesis protein)
MTTVPPVIDAGTGYRIVSARALLPELPADLSAIVFHDRAPVGHTIRVCAVGDTGLSGQVGRTASELGYGALLRDIAPLLQTGDAAFANLEGTLLERPAGDALFAAPPTAADALRQSGLTIVHLANNHVYDFGPTGLASTLAAVGAANLVALGAGPDAATSQRLVRTDREGVRVGWLGCGRTLLPQATGARFWEFDEQELLSAIRKARPSVDVLIASLHIGFMYLDYPHPDHRAIAQRCVAAGADVILMHHPHVLQGIETTPDGKILCYSLGNFLFDWKEGLITNQVMVQEQNEGAVFVFDLDRSGVARAAAVPTHTDERCCVRWASGHRGGAILDRLLRISRDLGGDYAAAFWRQRSERNTKHVLRMLRFYIVHGEWGSVWRMFTKVRRHHLRMLAHWALASLRTRRSKDSHAPAT